MAENRHSGHTGTRLTAHVVWVTKYRYDVLVGDIEVRCRDLLAQICDAEDVRALKGVVSKSHVHMHIEYPPSKSLSDLVRRLKGRTSRRLQEEYPALELLAEYASGASPAAPQKEYGYRAGELLVVAEPGDHLWADDAVPAGASQYGDGNGWNWVTGAPSPSSGATSHQSNVVAGLHQHFFAGATDKLAVAAGEKLIAYVYLDPSNPPSEVMLQWNSDQEGWNHRACWGADQIGWGANGTGSRRHVGALPAAGQWVRLEVPAGQVGLEGKTLNGMAFTLYGGRATWDRAGKSSASAGAGTRWLVTDQLGTPRMVVHQSGWYCCKNCLRTYNPSSSSAITLRDHTLEKR